MRAPTLETLPAAIAANVALARSRVGDRTAVMAVVKADGFGHGATVVARAAVGAGATWLGTTDVAAAVDLRAAGFAEPILAWLHPAGLDADVAGAASAEAIDVAVGSVDALSSLLAAAPPSPLRVHLHLDTGMAREGCRADGWDALVDRAAAGERCGTIRVVGLMGHLACADEASPAANAAAVDRLGRARRALASAGLRPSLVHLAGTAGTLTDPATHLDLVRFGAGLVGIDPSGTTDLHGASRLTAPVVHVSSVPAGTPIGYGGTHVTAAPAHLAVLPLGYADGIPRELSPAAAVELAGRRCPIVGRVSMDQVVVDTGPDRVPLGTQATVFGPAGGTAPTVHDWARWAGTIAHTIVTGIGMRVRRAVA